MKIAIINSKFDLGSNTGAEKFSKDLFEKLEKEGHDTYLLSSFKNEPKNKKFKKIYVTKNKFLRKLLFDYYNIFSSNSIKKKLKEINPDIVHFNNIYGISSYAVKEISKKYPTLMTVHDGWPLCYRATFFNGEKIVCDGFNCNCYYPLSIFHKKIVRMHLKDIKLVSPSIYLKKKLNKVFEDVEVINNGIEIPKEATNYKNNILFVGRITREKGLQTIASSLNNLDINIQILGEGDLKEILKKRYKKLKFFGFQNPEKYYRNSSILIVPSIWQENFPYSIIEGMSYGLCVIGTNLGGIPEMIKSNKTGMLFNAKDKKDFDDKIAYLLNNPKKVKKLGKNARNYVMENLNSEKMVKNYKEIYIKLKNGKK